MLVVIFSLTSTMHTQFQFLHISRVAELLQEDGVLKFKGTADYFANSCYNLITWSVVTVVCKCSAGGYEISSLLTIYQLPPQFRTRQLHCEWL